ncbi:3-ketoacyl-ACP reductase [Terrihabitans soli]|uniref:3-ketoacyl-ACP reductase n=1 Tax=Terrihabitans soli TaxID=708113 RepID=A0A6S6QWM1_9HYPH|nr:3-oxoacyl-ACP reductase family protein [Terrihabitans soli]BCJ91430.1 3-ketoacyl-ACP reductase [Terrihabitans soli]
MAGKDKKVALVTGGSRGIGAAIVERLAEDGFDVAFTYVSGAAPAKALEEKLNKAGHKVTAFQADSADAAAVEGAVEKTFSQFGRIDLLVNNAGVAPDAPVDDVPLDVIDRTIAINTRSVFIASRTAAKHMQKGGRIVSIGSCLGERVGFPGVSLYSMTKAALVGLTRGMARDYGPRGITVNVVEPGPIDTDMNPADGENAEYLKTLTALGSYGQGKDIAAMVSFLAGDGGRYVTGASLLVDGGVNA